MPLDFYCYPLSCRVPIQGVIMSLIDIALCSISYLERKQFFIFLYLYVIFRSDMLHSYRDTQWGGGGVT